MGCASEEEVSRLVSPDRRVDAVWVRDSGGGATVGISYLLYIVPTGRAPERGMQQLVADHIDNVTLRWREPRRLEVAYDQARIFNFFSFWQHRELDNFNYVVEIRLIPNRPW